MTIKMLYIVMVIFLLGLIWLFIEPQLYRIKHISITSDKINKKIKVIFISDLHHGKYYFNSRLKKIVASINKLEGDLIIIGGDYLDNNMKSIFDERLLNALFSELHFLKSKRGIFTVLGNHDHYLGENMSYLLDLFKLNKFTLLKNDTVEVKIDQEQVFIHGVDDFSKGKIDIRQLKMSPTALNIVVSHNPDFYEGYKLDFDIGLSGHTHGGQITLFGLYAPVTESKYGQRYARRVNKKKHSTIITTKGLGCSIYPIRFCAMPEIIELEIIPSKHN